jgi:hypothetical protein
MVPSTRLVLEHEHAFAQQLTPTYIAKLVLVLKKNSLCQGEPSSSVSITRSSDFWGILMAFLEHEYNRSWNIYNLGSRICPSRDSPPRSISKRTLLPSVVPSGDTPTLVVHENGYRHGRIEVRHTIHSCGDYFIKINNQASK